MGRVRRIFDRLAIGIVKELVPTLDVVFRGDIEAICEGLDQIADDPFVLAVSGASFGDHLAIGWVGRGHTGAQDTGGQDFLNGS